MKKNHWSDSFREQDACVEALIEARKYPTFQDWWDATDRADWMLWGLAHIEPVTMDFWRCVCVCARHSLHIFEEQYPEDMRPRAAIELREKWIENPDSVSDDELLIANAAAYATATATAAAYTAAYAAAYAAAAAAAYAAAYAANATYTAANTATYATAATAAAAAYALTEMANSIRKISPSPTRFNREV